MSVYKKSSLDIYFGAGSNNNIPCQVRLDKGSIAVSYEDDNGPVVYEGTEDGPGHYRLRCAANGARATLHRFAGDETLEGYWIASSDEGMWRIALDE